MKTKDQQLKSPKRPAAPETPRSSKRVKVKHEPFQFAEEVPRTPAKRPANSGSQEVLLYKKGSFFAVRNEEGSFYLCQALQHVFHNFTKPIKVLWLSTHGTGNVYKLDYMDTVDLECIVCRVKLEYMSREVYRLPDKEERRISSVLNMVLGNSSASNNIDEEDEPMKKRARIPKGGPKASTSNTVKVPKKTVKRENVTDPPTPKAKKTTKNEKIADKIKKKARKMKVVSKKVKKVKKEKKDTKNKDKKKKKEVKAAKVKVKVDLTDPNRRLKPNPAIKVWEKDPLFETKENVPFVSSTAHSKLVIRAVLMNDMKLLQQLVDDRKQVHSVSCPRSLEVPWSAVHYAILKGNQKALKILGNELHESTPSRVCEPYSFLKTQGTGYYNRRSLGIRAVRRLNMSRGGKEGNNAFTKDLDKDDDEEELLPFVLKHGVSAEMLTFLMVNRFLDKNEVFEHIYMAVRHGHNKLACKLMEEYDNQGGYAIGGFSNFHKEALTFDGKQDWKAPIREASAKKKANQENMKITPIHCAAINPNAKYLAKLLSAAPEYNLMDHEMRRPVHYAAACTGTGPLEYLIGKGVSTSEIDKQGYNPLLIAAETGREHNVDLLLKTAKAQVSPDEPVGKYGFGGLNAPNKASMCPIHLAIMNGHQKVVEVLLKYGVDIEKPLNADNGKVTPLMLAASKGDVAMVKLLIKHKAKIEKLDKLKRSAFMHSIINGNLPVASYLASLGADIKRPDSSGNTCLHYACAYGWYFCMKMLLDAGADPNLPNDWKLTPLGVAYLKGHRGLSEILLDLPGIDIDFKDEGGKTLLLNEAAKWGENQYKNICKLVKDKGASCTVVDNDGNGALHLIAKQTLPFKVDESEAVVQNWISDTLKVVELLLENGCEVNAENDKTTPIMLAIKQLQHAPADVKSHPLITRNLQLIKLLLSKMAEVPDQEDLFGENILHMIAEHCVMKPVGMELLDLLLDMEKIENKKSGESSSKLQDMARVRSGANITPLMAAGFVYKSSSYTTIDEKHPRELIEGIWVTGRAFIKKLIDVFNSEVEYSFEEKNGDKITIIHKSLMFYMVDSNEIGMTVDGEYKRYPGLEMILKYNPTIDLPTKEQQTALMVSVINDDYVAADLLLKAGADVNFRWMKDDSSANQCRYTSLMYAVNAMSLPMTKLLVKYGADIHVCEANTGNSLLHIAVRNYCTGTRTKEKLEWVRYLLDIGLDINVKNSHQRNILHLAVNLSTDSADEPRDLEMLLIERGVDVFASDIRGRLPLHYAFVKFGRHTDSSRTDPIEMCSILASAMKNKGLDTPDNFGQAPLHTAAYRGATVSCMLLVQKGTYVDVEDNNSNTPLTLAVLGKHDSCALSLIQKGADVNKTIVVKHPSESKVAQKQNPKFIFKPAYKWLPRHWPAPPKPQIEKFPVFQRVVENGWQGVSYIVMDLMESFGMKYATAVEIAFRIQKIHFACSLIRKQVDHQKLLTVNDDQRNLLHLMAFESKQDRPRDVVLEVAQMLVDKGVSHNAKDKHGCTPLHYAAMNHDNPLLKFLLDRQDVDVNMVDNYGRTPLAAALWNNPKESQSTCQSLVYKHAKTDMLFDFPPLDLFNGAYDNASRKNCDYFKDKNSDVQLTVLIVAIVHRHEQLLKALLTWKDQSVNVGDSNGVTPIMYAVKTNEINLVKILLDQPDIKLDCKDKAGQTVVHHLVNSMEKASYDNVDILKLLVDADVPVDVPDKAGKIPLDYALKMAPALSAELQRIMGRSKNQMKVPKFQPTPVKDGIVWSTPPPDVSADALAMRGLLEAEELKEMEKKKEPVASPDWRAIDSSSPKEKWEVAMDTAQNIPYDILMTKVDTKFGSYGLYNYYKMQIIHDQEGLYVLFNNWGRIGDSGQFQKTPFSTREEAVDEYCKIFKAKAGNDWNNLNNFVNQPKKYRLVSADKRRKQTRPPVNFDLHSDLPSKLPRYVQDFIKDISSVSMLTKQWERCGVDPSLFPFGRIKRETFQKAIDLLLDIKPLVKRKDELSRDLTEGNLPDYQDVCEKIHEHSSEYYQLIPKNGYKFERLTPLDSERSIESEINMILSLMELNFTERVLLAAQYRAKEINPLDYIYRALNCRMELLKEEEPEAQYILKYIYNTEDTGSYRRYGPKNELNVEAIYRIEREGETERIQNCTVGNRMLLWHGTNTCNLTSILHHGLLIDPPDVEKHGSLFGKGIYHADTFNKSQGYCRNYYSETESKYMLLDEVAVGKVEEKSNFNHTETSSGYDSLLGAGTQIPEPGHDLTLAGAKMPLGKIVNRPQKKEEYHYYSLSYNEYVVYKANQVAMKYLVQFQGY
ncbi:tankyrase-like protein isoform X2 [Lingula anatina]|uniref:Poly [ADP-ribose] polymerase n=1 Tax=Lingula anatina TaxID=7574 RepID=A0A1S3J5B4_LINAN|nr:tankyrase-like protein isoform X1 [Lingula anatina]XP_013405622.1 tankyrase-like protein isoform X2 [Lingula anatina]|eukprot:XP_013405621.1 tankyrase-like protein isoform X1 [Lingula anatina]